MLISLKPKLLISEKTLKNPATLCLLLKFSLYHMTAQWPL